jgi:hypothetical protein
LPAARAFSTPAGEPGSRELPLDITRDFDQVFAMIRKGDYAEAEEHVRKHWLGRSWACYQRLGDLYLRFGGASESSGYVGDLALRQPSQGSFLAGSRAFRTRVLRIPSRQRANCRLRAVVVQLEPGVSYDITFS